MCVTLDSIASIKKKKMEKRWILEVGGLLVVEGMTLKACGSFLFFFFHFWANHEVHSFASLFTLWHNVLLQHEQKQWGQLIMD
jgi:hypothetical protein